MFAGSAGIQPCEFVTGQPQRDHLDPLGDFLTARITRR
jgi:hypothetical protein